MKKQGHKKIDAVTAELLAVLSAVAGVLEAPRDRLGRLDIASTQGEQREALRLLAVKFGATGGSDYMDQCAAVCRAAIRRAKGGA